MATADSVKSKIQNLIDKSNTKTGASDVDLTSAVDRLVGGYGQGGGGIVPGQEQVSVVRTVNVSANVTGANTLYKLLTGDEFIKEHYADEGFSATLICMTPVAAGTNIVHFGYHGNRNIGASNQTRYGFGLRSTNTSTVAFQPFTAKINGTGYSNHMRVNSSGDLIQYLYTGYVLPAGTYQIILTCTPE